MLKSPVMRNKVTSDEKFMRCSRPIAAVERKELNSSKRQRRA